MAKTVTTRRTIRPSGGVEARVEPPRSEALQSRPAKPTTLWGSWQVRFAAQEQQMALALAIDLVRARQLPRQADLPEVRRLQAVWLDPWSGLQETFDAAASTTQLPEALLRDYRLFLGLRAAQLRALTRCFLAPTEASVRQLDEAQTALDRFIAARRAGG